MAIGARRLQWPVATAIMAEAIAAGMVIMGHHGGGYRGGYYGGGYYGWYGAPGYGYVAPVYPTPMRAASVWPRATSRSGSANSRQRETDRASRKHGTGSLRVKKKRRVGIRPGVRRYGAF